MDKKFSTSFISFAFLAATITSLAISTISCPKASAYGYLATSEALTTALDKSQFPEEQKYEIYRRLVLILPLVQSHITKIDAFKVYTREALASIMIQLFTNLFSEVANASTYEQLITSINHFFVNYGTVPTQISPEKLTQFIIKTTSYRFLQYINLMMQCELPPLLTNRHIFHHEKLLMQHYDPNIVSAILRRLNQQFTQGQSQLVKKLDFSSVRHTVMIYQAMDLLTLMIEHFSGHQELIYTLKQQFSHSVFSHHAHLHQNNPEVLNHLIRLVMSLFNPELSLRSMIAAPNDFPLVMQFLASYRMFLRALSPDWEHTLVQPLSMDLALPQPPQSSASLDTNAPEEPNRATATPPPASPQTETSGAAGSHTLLRLAITGSSDSFAPMATGQVITDETPTLEEIYTPPENEKPVDANAENVKPEREKEVSPEPVKEKKPDIADAPPSEALRKKAEQTKHIQRDAAYKRRKAKEKKEAQKKLELLKKQAVPENQKAAMPDESNNKKTYAQRQESQKPPEPTSDAPPFNTAKKQTPAISSVQKKRNRSHRRRARNTPKAQTERAEVSKEPLPQKTETPKTTATDGSQREDSFPKTGKESGKPAQQTISDLHPRALKFLDYLLKAVQKKTDSMLLTGSNAGQLMLRDIYSHDPEFALIWDFTTSDTDFPSRFSQLFKLLPPPFTYKNKVTEGHQMISLFEQQEGDPDRELISFRFKLVNKIPAGEKSHLSPYDKLNIHSVEQQINALETLLDETEFPSTQDLQFLKQWRQLEENGQKLSKKLRKKLYALGRDKTAPYGRDPVLDEQIRQALPPFNQEDNYSVSDVSSLPDTLLCEGCKQPNYHTLQLPCGFRMCRQCVEQSRRDITDRLVCPAPNCPQAHYPSKIFRDAAIIKELKAYADPATLISLENTHYLKESLDNIQTRKSRHSSPLAFELLLPGSRPEVRPDEETRKEYTRALSECAVIDKTTSPSLDHLLKYHEKLIMFARCHAFLQTSASHQPEALTEDIKRHTQTRDIINHSFDLVQEGIALLEPYYHDPGNFINIAIVVIDVALMHSQNQQYLNSLSSAKQLSSGLKLLSTTPSGFYPQFMKKVSPWIKQIQHNPLTGEPLFMLQRFSQIFPYILDEKNHSTLFGEAPPAATTEALLTHLSLITTGASLQNQYQSWIQFLTYLLTKMQALLTNTEHDTQNTIRLVNLLAGQISTLLTSLSHRVYHSGPGESPSADDTTQLLQQLINDVLPFFKEIRNRVVAQTGLPDDLHSFIQNPDTLQQLITESRQLMQESFTKAEQFRTEQQESWAEQKQVLLEKDRQERATLSVSKETAEKTKTDGDYSQMWKGYSEFEQQQGLLNDAYILAHHLQFLQNQVPPIGPELPYQQLNPNELLQTLDQLYSQASTLTVPTPSLIRYYQISLHGLVVNATLQNMFDSLEHVEMMETSLNYFRTRMETISQSLESSHRTFARWYNMRQHPAWEISDTKVAARLMNDIHELRGILRDILNKTSMTSAWLERWYRAFDTTPLPLPKDSSRRTRQHTAHLINNLPPDYALHEVNPNGNCLYAAILMGLHPTHQQPSLQQVAGLRKKLHRLLNKIIKTIKKAPAGQQRAMLWQQLSSVMGLSMEQIQALLTQGTILTPVTGAMTPAMALSLFGDMAFVTPLAILQLNTSLSTMSVADPAHPETWIQSHMNIFSTWLHNAPLLLSALVEDGVIDIAPFEHGAQLALALISQDQEHITELVSLHSPTQTPFALVHTGSSEDGTGHFFLATHSAPAGEAQPLVLDLEVNLEQLQTGLLSNAAMLTLLEGLLATNRKGLLR